MIIRETDIFWKILHIDIVEGFPGDSLLAFLSLVLKYWQVSCDPILAISWQIIFVHLFDSFLGFFHFTKLDITKAKEFVVRVYWYLATQNLAIGAEFGV